MIKGNEVAVRVAWVAKCLCWFYLWVKPLCGQFRFEFRSKVNTPSFALLFDLHDLWSEIRALIRFQIEPLLVDSIGYRRRPFDLDFFGEVAVGGE